MERRGGDYDCVLQDVLGYKVDVSVVQFIMSILDYVAADILKVGVALVGMIIIDHTPFPIQLAGIFVKNTHIPSMTIAKRDVLVSLSADPVRCS